MFASLVAVTLAGVIHDHHEEKIHDAEPSETEHHLEIDHKHAQSHQSFKMFHSHPVPVYVKKEDQKYLKHPVEIAHNNHKVKLIHPETEKHHGHGLTLENHSEFKSHKIEHHHEPEHHHGYNFEGYGDISA